MNKNYEYLANAVILQAVQDYRDALGFLRCYPGNIECAMSMHELECFFHSKWFRFLTKANPETLIGMLQNEAADAGSSLRRFPSQYMHKF